MNRYEKRPINADNRADNQKEKQTTKKIHLSSLQLYWKSEKDMGEEKKGSVPAEIGKLIRKNYNFRRYLKQHTLYFLEQKLNSAKHPNRNLSY